MSGGRIAKGEVIQSLSFCMHITLRFSKAILLFSLTAASFLLSPSAFGQDKDCERLLTELSSVEKKKFFERLEQYVQLNRDKRWTELFELSIDRVTKGEEQLPTFLEIRNARMSSTDRIDFVPATSGIVNMFGESRIWLVEGCGNLQSGAKTLRVRYGLNAMLNKGIWYFDDLALLTDGVGGKALRCP